MIPPTRRLLTTNGALEDEVAQLWGQGPGARWRRLPGGSLGAGGIAELDGAGTLQSSTTTSLVLNTHAGPTLAAIGFGTEPTHTPLLGATLVPLPFASLTLITDASGTGSLSFPWANGLPAGLQYWLQAWYLDPSSASGLAASNALLATTP